MGTAALLASVNSGEPTLHLDPIKALSEASALDMHDSKSLTSKEARDQLRRAKRYDGRAAADGLVDTMAKQLSAQALMLNTGINHSPRQAGRRGV